MGNSKSLVFYRHTGQPEIGNNPFIHEWRTINEAEILENVGDHTITHMALKKFILPSIFTVAPNLLELEVVKLDNPAELEG